MSVIIDTFEIVNDSQQSSQESTGESGASSAGMSNSMKPNEIISVMNHFDQRCDRVRAH